jgi:GNAT superfamily N-acetyltransferase
MKTQGTGSPVRQADPSEYAALAELQLRTVLVAFRHIFPEAAPRPTLTGMAREWRSLLSDSTGAGVAFVIGAPGEVIGVAVARLPPTDGGRETATGTLQRVYVDPGHWAGGHGSALVEAALDWLGRQGCTEAELWTLERNRQTRGWYERRGWELVDGRLEIWAPGGIADVRYRRTLTPPDLSAVSPSPLRP